MKRIGNLYEKLFDMDLLYRAYLDASKSKRGKSAQFDFSRHLGRNLEDLKNELMQGTYKPREYKKFKVYEPKERIIYAPEFRDCVIQHAVYNLILDYFDKSFIHQSYACRKNKGTHKASEYVQNSIRKISDDSYILKLDIKKFFYNIDREILRKLLERKIKDKQFLKLLCSFNEFENDLGIPIGNLLSQLFAIVYMNPVDHFVKRILKVSYYCRYVDDMVLMGLTKDQCISHRNSIEDFLRSKLKLKYSKTSISKVSRGLNFVGYRTWKTHRLIRIRSIKNFKKQVKLNRLESIISYLAHSLKTSSKKFLLKFLEETNNALYCQVPKSLSRWNHISAKCS